MNVSFSIDMRLSQLPANRRYWLKNYREVGPTIAPLPTVGNFSAITLFPVPQLGTGGQNNWVEIEKPEIDWIKHINADSYKTWSWAIQAEDEQGGEPYRAVEGISPDLLIHWMRVGMASNEVGHRNQVMVRELSAYGHFARIAAIPKSADYTQFGNCPWLIHTAYTIYPDGHTGAQALYKIPIWDPASGFKVNMGETGLWIQTEWLHSLVAGG